MLYYNIFMSNHHHDHAPSCACGHDHAHQHEIKRPVAASLLAVGSGRRLLIAALVLAAIWGATFWALNS